MSKKKGSNKTHKLSTRLKFSSRLYKFFFSLFFAHFYWTRKWAKQSFPLSRDWDTLYIKSTFMYVPCYAKKTAGTVEWASKRKSRRKKNEKNISFVFSLCFIEFCSGIYLFMHAHDFFHTKAAFFFPADEINFPPRRKPRASCVVRSIHDENMIISIFSFCGGGGRCDRDALQHRVWFSHPFSFHPSNYPHHLSVCRWYS